MTRFAWGAVTETGRVRQANEDSILAVDGLFAVADGMGGHKAGEVASHLAIETLQDEFASAGTEVLVGAVQDANRVLVERSSADVDLAGMGTTICAMALVDVEGSDAIAVVNVGDSRLYLMSEGELTQITEDHSLVATLERQGRLSRAEAAVHPQRNIVTRALGIDSNVMVDSWEILPVVGDRYLICSDGLYNEVDDNRVSATLRRLADPEEAARELVRLANEAGGRDNISCVVVDVVDDAGRDPAVASTAERVTSSVTAGDAAVMAGVDGEQADDPDAGDETSSRRRRRKRARPDDDGVEAGVVVAVEKRRIFTWRVGLFLVAFVAIIAVAFGFVVYSGRSTYYVGIDGEQVAIYRGKPGGVLWIQPELAETTELSIDDVPAAQLDAVHAGVEEPTLADAQEYVANLAEVARRATTTTTTSTTTTLPLDPTAPTAPTDPAPGGG